MDRRNFLNGLARAGLLGSTGSHVRNSYFTATGNPAAGVFRKFSVQELQEAEGL